MKWAGLVVVAACTSPVDPWPEPQLDPLPDDPRLGSVLDDRSGQYGAQLLVTTNGNDAFVAVGSFDAPPNVYRIDLETSQIVPLPAPPRALNSDRFGISWTSGTCLLGNMFWDGAAWTTIPNTPAPFTDDLWVARSATQIIAGDHYWNGSEWLVRVHNPGTALGPWDASGIREVWTEGASVCTAVLDPVTPMRSTPVCTPTETTGSVRDAHNGTIDDFMVLGEFGPTSLYRFHAGTWSLGDAVGLESRLAPAPGAAVTTMTTPNPLLNFHERPAVSEVSAAHVTRSLVPSYDTVLTCTCDRNVDPECPCASGFVYPYIVFDRDHTQGAIITQREIDARLKIYLRVFTPPLATSPF